MGFFTSRVVKAVLSSLENSDIFDRLLDRLAKKLANEVKLNAHGSSIIGNSVNKTSEKHDQTLDDFNSMSMIAKAVGTVDKKVFINGDKFQEKVIETDKTKNEQVLDILKDL